MRMPATLRAFESMGGRVTREDDPLLKRVVIRLRCPFEDVTVTVDHVVLLSANTADAVMADIWETAAIQAAVLLLKHGGKPLWWWNQGALEDLAEGGRNAANALDAARRILDGRTKHDPPKGLVPG